MYLVNSVLFLCLVFTELTCMVPVSSLKLVFCESHVCFLFHIVRSGYGGLVHYSFSKAFARKRAFILHAAVALFYVRVLVICFFFGEYRFVVCSDDTLNARHTTAAGF